MIYSTKNIYFFHATNIIIIILNNNYIFGIYIQNFIWK